MKQLIPPYIQPTLPDHSTIIEANQILKQIHDRFVIKEPRNWSAADMRDAAMIIQALECAIRINKRERGASDSHVERN